MGQGVAMKDLLWRQLSATSTFLNPGLGSKKGSARSKRRKQARAAAKRAKKAEK